MPRRYYVSVLIGYSLIVSGMVLFVSWKLYEEKMLTRSLRLEQSVRTGDRLPVFGATSLDGSSVAIDYSENNFTVLCFIRSDCPYCSQAATGWNKLHAMKPDLKVVGLAVDGLRALRRRRDRSYTFPVVEFPSQRVADRFRVPAVPLTVVVDRTGVVVLSMPGALDDSRLKEILSALL